MAAEIHGSTATVPLTHTVEHLLPSHHCFKTQSMPGGTDWWRVVVVVVGAVCESLSRSGGVRCPCWPGSSSRGKQMNGRRSRSDSVMLRLSKRVGVSVAHLWFFGSISLKRGWFEMLAWKDTPRQRMLFRINHVSRLLNPNTYSCFIV